MQMHTSTAQKTLATSKNVLYPGHNHLLATSTDGPTLLSPERQQVKGHQHRWFAGRYELQIGHFLEVASMVVTR